MAGKKKARNEKQARSAKMPSDMIAYRLKCAKTANGLSHFVMYGDVKKENTVL